MAFTGETIHGWRIAQRPHRRRAFVPTPDGRSVPGWVEEPVVELVKGHRHIRIRGQDAPVRIDPDTLIGRAVRYALRDDIRDAIERRAFDEVFRLTDLLDRHERWLRVLQDARIGRRTHAKATAAVFAAPTAGSRAGT